MNTTTKPALPLGGVPQKGPYDVTEKGYYGEFGGAYIPEMLYPNIEELRRNYLQIMAEPLF